MSLPLPALRLQFHQSLEPVDADWQLLEATGHCTPFQTRAWLHPFYRELAPRLGLTPMILRVADAATDQPLMLWPLVRQQRMGLSTLTFADAGVSDYNAPLLAARPSGAAAADAAPEHAWAPHLAEFCRQSLAAMRRQASVFQMDKLLPQMAGQPNPLVAPDGPASPMSFGTWAVDLPASAAEFHRQSLSPPFVKEVALRRRRLERRGAVALTLADTPELRRQAFEALVSQRARRFAETGRYDILGDPPFRRFYEAAAVEAPGDTVRLFMLTVGPTLVAVMLALDRQRVRYQVIPTFEAGEWKNLSPGNVLMMMTIERSIAEGFSRYDFTIGDEPYKTKFGTTRQVMSRGLQALSTVGGAAVAAATLARGLKARLRPGASPEEPADAPPVDASAAHATASSNDSSAGAAGQVPAEASAPVDAAPSPASLSNARDRARR